MHGRGLFNRGKERVETFVCFYFAAECIIAQCLEVVNNIFVKNINYFSNDRFTNQNKVIENFGNLCYIVFA